MSTQKPTRETNMLRMWDPMNDPKPSKAARNAKIAAVVTTVALAIVTAALAIHFTVGFNAAYTDVSTVFKNMKVWQLALCGAAVLGLIGGGVGYGVYSSKRKSKKQAEQLKKPTIVRPEPSRSASVPPKNIQAISNQSAKRPASAVPSLGSEGWQAHGGNSPTTDVHRLFDGQYESTSLRNPSQLELPPEANNIPRLPESDSMFTYENMAILGTALLGAAIIGTTWMRK